MSNNIGIILLWRTFVNGRFAVSCRVSAFSVLCPFPANSGIRFRSKSRKPFLPPMRDFCFPPVETGSSSDFPLYTGIPDVDFPSVYLRIFLAVALIFRFFWAFYPQAACSSVNFTGIASICILFMRKIRKDPPIKGGSAVIDKTGNALRLCHSVQRKFMKVGTSFSQSASQ